MTLIEQLWQIFSKETISDQDTRIYKGKGSKGDNTYCNVLHVNK